MSNAKQTEYGTLGSRETLITMIETLSGAFFFIDDTQTIVYANARAQAITGATLEKLRGNLFWRSAPQLVSTALYQAVLKTRQTQEPTEVEYGSPMTRSWLHVQLAPTIGGSCCISTRGVHQPDARRWFPQASRSPLLSWMGCMPGSGF